MRAYLSLIDQRTDGRRCDVTPLFRDPEAFRAAVDDLLELGRPATFNLVAGIDALGFILGTAAALHAGVGLVPLRKGGKLPVPAQHVDFDDYDGLRKRLVEFGRCPGLSTTPPGPTGRSLPMPSTATARVRPS